MECRLWKCKGCKEPRMIVNKYFELCQGCNNIRLHGNKYGKQSSFIRIDSKFNKRSERELLRRVMKGDSSHKVKRTLDNSNKREVRVIVGGRRFGRSHAIKIWRIQQDEIFYEKCFNTSNHKCEECGKNLPQDFRDDDNKVIARWRYSHIIAKSIAPELRYTIKNINHLCLEHHTQWDFGDKKIMKIYKSNSKRFPQFF